MLEDALGKTRTRSPGRLDIPSLTGVLPIIKHTDLCAMLPRAWLRLYAAPKDFATAPVPLPEMEFTVDLFSDPSRDQDPGHVWLRRLIQEEMRALHRLAAGAWIETQAGLTRLRALSMHNLHVNMTNMHLLAVHPNIIRDDGKRPH